MRKQELDIQRSTVAPRKRFISGRMGGDRRSLDPGPKDLGDTPGLRYAPSWHVGRLCIENLTDASDTGRFHLCGECLEKLPCGFVGVHFHPSINKWPHQPSPN